MSWIFDEYKHSGIDYSDEKQANKYDNEHQSFRNYEKEFNDMLEFLNAVNTSELSVIDLGCGTGATTFYATQRFKHVYAVDISEVMLKQTEKKLKDATNVTIIQSGFLSYKHDNNPVDLLITKAAFHHLPDFWKQIALLNMNKMIKPGGMLYIHDIVYDFEATEYKDKINNWLDGFRKIIKSEFLVEVETHIRDEFSTFKWILDVMIEKAGFRIEKSRSVDGFVTEYHCIKTQDISIEL